MTARMTRRTVKEKMDDKNITYASNLTQTGAKELMQADLDAQMKKSAINMQSRKLVPEVMTCLSIPSMQMER